MRLNELSILIVFALNCYTVCIQRFRLDMLLRNPGRLIWHIVEFTVPKDGVRYVTAQTTFFFIFKYNNNI